MNNRKKIIKKILPSVPDEPLQQVDRQWGQQEQQHLVRRVEQVLERPLLRKQLRRRDADAVRDEHARERDDEQVVAEPKVCERVERRPHPRASKPGGPLGPARRERVGDSDEKHQDPPRDEGPGGRDVAQRQPAGGPQPHLLLCRAARPDERGGSHEDAVEDPGEGADDREPGVVLDGVVEVEEAAEVGCSVRGGMGGGGWGKREEEKERKKEKNEMKRK